ncbi:molybdopterin converting factor subunit 1 [Betaproteobacteria bacterium GR16-43]|nr:molybdopterin converting factor subunit 1 [Betaproteobacteria bacterium GR16-43]
MVTLLYFASLRESVACSREQVPLTADTTTVASLLDQLRSRGERWAQAFAPGKAYRVAVNQQMADLATPLRPGDEVAFFPPVTGG